MSFESGRTYVVSVSDSILATFISEWALQLCTQFTNAKAQDISADLSGGDNTSVIGFPTHRGTNQQVLLILVDVGNCTLTTLLLASGPSKMREKASSISKTAQDLTWASKPQDLRV